MLAEDTFQTIKMPLTANEIWDKATEFHLKEKLAKYGATPQATISAQIYTEIKKNGSSIEFFLGK